VLPIPFSEDIMEPKEEQYRLLLVKIAEAMKVHGIPGHPWLPGHVAKPILREIEDITRN
jgi:hypothetical protein